MIMNEKKNQLFENLEQFKRKKINKWTIKAGK